MADAAKTGLVVNAGGGATTGSARVVQVWSTIRARYVALAPRRRNTLMAALLAVVALAAGVMWYAGRTDWRVLFAGLEARDVQQVSQELGAAGIPFHTTADGTGVEVPAELLDKARMEVASKGMPGSGRLGFELFDKPNWVGSEFDERVNYQRALEGELEHTIGSLSSVRSARVHLVLPRESLFATEEKQARASVVLKLRHGMGQEEADSIRNLVAGAVDNLHAQDVTLVDADGRANLQRKGRTAEEGEQEQRMEGRLIAMLEPLAGAGNVRATVNVSYDEGTEDRTDEVYDPARTATLSSQKTQQSAGGGTVHAQGVPGTASNAPVAAADAAVAGGAEAAGSAETGTPPLLRKTGDLPVYPQSAAPGGSRTEESGTYAVSRHVAHTQVGPGRVSRVSAAVVVNDRETTAGTGKAEHVVWTPRNTEEMHRLEELARAAVGFDEKRGDQVVLQNVAFSANGLETKAAGLAGMTESARTLLSQQPGLLKTVLTAALSVLLVMFVLRPLAGQVAHSLRAAAVLENSPALPAGEVAVAELTQSVAVAEQDGEAVQPVTQAVQALPARRQPRVINNAAVFDQVAEHIRREPQGSTQLLQAWIGAEETD